jgi:hypothetical protein
LKQAAFYVRYDQIEITHEYGGLEIDLLQANNQSNCGYESFDKPYKDLAQNHKQTLDISTPSKITINACKRALLNSGIRLYSPQKL